ncbi:unnamed protein product, partial [Didymodactylos carnosus]
MMGTINDRNRHIRIELSDKKEYEVLLNCGKIPLYFEVEMNELKRNPNILPPGVQLFIPSEYRNPGERLKSIYNKTTQVHQQQLPRRQQQQNYNRNDNNTWPQLNVNASSSSQAATTTQISNQFTDCNLNHNVKVLEEEMKTIKQKIEEDQNRIKQKYKDHLTSMNQSWMLMQQQIHTQTESLKIM